VPHYKACTDGLKDGLVDTIARISRRNGNHSFGNGFFPRRTNKLRIIQLMEADLHQVLRAAFARNVTNLVQNHKGVISEHQYGWSHRTYIIPILNKLLTIQKFIQKQTNGIIFDNDAKGCYDRIIIGISLATARILGYSKHLVRMLGKLME
jgi:hypothetical protein